MCMIYIINKYISIYIYVYIYSSSLNLFPVLAIINGNTS